MQTTSVLAAAKAAEIFVGTVQSLLGAWRMLCVRMQLQDKI